MENELFFLPFILFFIGQTRPVNISPRVILSSWTAVGTDRLPANITRICRFPETATLALELIRHITVSFLEQINYPVADAYVNFGTLWVPG